MKSRTGEILEQLKAYESQNITFCDPDGTWPIVWERAKGMHVWDVEGRKFVDWTAAFGVAAAGHANPRVIAAGRKQMSTLLHAMGDVHPHPLKAELARALSEVTFERWLGKRRALPRNVRSDTVPAASIRGKVIFCNSGFEAVEAALKTAYLATGKPGVIAFHGAYHGLGYGALNATHREFFRTRFRGQLGQFVEFMPFPQDADALKDVLARIEEEFASRPVGAILVEPIQARGGMNVPAPDFLSGIRRLCDRLNGCLILDEIFTGFGRAGEWFACELTRTVPDLICLGKALTGGFPLSVCVGRAELMDRAWPPSAGEAIHTSTFLGHPVGCRMALAQLREVARVLPQARTMGALLKAELSRLRAPNGLEFEVRGAGLMLGVAIQTADGKPASRAAWRIVKGLLEKGQIVLPEGEFGNVIGLTPPLIVKPTHIRALIQAWRETVGTLRAN